MNTQVPELIKPLLKEYLALTEETLPAFIKAFYLHGSIAPGAFNERWSDIDFITLTSRRYTEHDVEFLKAIHHTLATAFPRWPLQGSYLPWEDVAQHEQTRTPALTYHDGLLQTSISFDVNDDVTWWLLKYRGIALMGPEPQQLELAVDWDVLIARMRHNLNTYWASFTRKPRRIAWLFTKYGIQWAVLGVLRQWYTFQEQDITSKTGAGEYALIHLPSRWHHLIREAINIREQPNSTLYRSRIGRAIEAVQFLRYVIRLCN